MFPGFDFAVPDQAHPVLAWQNVYFHEYGSSPAARFVGRGAGIRGVKQERRQRFIQVLHF